MHTRHSDHQRKAPRSSGHPQPSNSVPSQILARALNEQIYARRNSFTKSDIEIMCECERRDCSKRLRISMESYEAIRKSPIRFVTSSGHASADERVIEEQKQFVVVEKTGVSARAAIRLDPRPRRDDYRPAA
jgi:hypothetical protein